MLFSTYSLIQEIRLWSEDVRNWEGWGGTSKCWYWIVEDTRMSLPNLNIVHLQVVSIPSSCVDLEGVLAPEGVLLALRSETMSVDCAKDMAYVHESFTESISVQYQLRMLENLRLQNESLTRNKYLQKLREWCRSCSEGRVKMQANVFFFEFGSTLL